MKKRISGKHLRLGCPCCDGGASANRRSFLKGSAAFGAAAAGGFFASATETVAQGVAATPPRGNEYVVKGGYVITMDRTLGDVPLGDVHVRNGAIVMVTLLATSKKGDKVGLHGPMTLIDEDGDKYKSEGGNARPQLREGVPVKIVWRFGPNSLGKSSAPSPKITRFASLSVAPTRASEVSALEFRNVPAELAKPKGK